MDIDKGRLYVGEDEVKGAKGRGERLLELTGIAAEEARALHARGESAFVSPDLSRMARAERKRRNKAAKRARVAQGKRRRGK